MEENQKISKKLLILDAFFVISIILMIFVIYDSTNEDKQQKVVKREEPQNENKVFPNIEIVAKSAYVLDVLKNEVIFKKNEIAQLPLASITKIMTALTATELVPNNSKIVIKKEFLNEEGDSGLLSNETWKLKDLLDFSLVVSSNDGARSVASVIGSLNLEEKNYSLGRKEFVSKMNEKAKEIGLIQTYFINETGLDEGLKSGGYGSAIDVAKTVKYILKNHPDILEATKYGEREISSDNKVHFAENTNIQVSEIPGLLASKTGYTSLAGGNLVVAFDASLGRPVIVVVLGSTIEDRFLDTKKLVEASLDYIRQ